MSTEPRTWSLPAEPEGVKRVQDAHGGLWVRGDVPDLPAQWWTNVESYVSCEWPGLLKHGPLTEVAETEVEAATRRLREAGFSTRHTAGYAGAYNDLLTLARHVLNGGSL